MKLNLFIKNIIIILEIILIDFCSSDTIPVPRNCGRFNKLTNGLEPLTGLGEFPWNVALEYDSIDPKFRCNGVLISARYVIAAAHCVQSTIYNNKLIAIHVGRQNLEREVDCDGNICSDPYQRIEVEEIIIHENYLDRRQSKSNNIALLRLKDEVTFNRFVSPVCLPFSSNLFSEPREGNPMIITGWGNIKYNDNNLNYKRRVDVTYANQDECKEIFGPQYLNTSFCTKAKRNEVDVCQGFSGAAVVQNFGEYWAVQGIVSFGKQCGQGIPVGNTRISIYKDWIIGNINPKFTTISHTADLLPEGKDCGDSFASSVIRGTMTGLYEYPWAVLVEKNGEHLCSGFLISRRYVLTSANCAEYGITHVVAGEYDTSQDVDCITESDETICNDRIQKAEVDEVIIHEGYSKRGNALLNNIAVIRLKQRVFLTDSVFPICMPSSVASFTASKVPQTLTVTGWGNTEAFGAVSTKKQKVLLAFVNNTECASRLEVYRFSPSNSLLCAGLSTRIHVCNEFSGSVLMKEVDGTWVAEGIFSGTFGCRPETPGIYTKLTYYESWITNKLRS